jgi:hypothetical protein
MYREYVSFLTIHVKNPPFYLQAHSQNNSSSIKNSFYQMSSAGSSPLSCCAAGIYCKVPSLDVAHSIHKCFFCLQVLHGLCGVPHDPDNINYQNCCHLCNYKFFQSLTATPSSVPWDSLLVPINAHGSSIVQVISTDLIRQPSSLTSCSSTPTFSMLSTSDIDDTIANDDVVVLPYWFSLDLGSIYDKLNPCTKTGNLNL